MSIDLLFFVLLFTFVFFVILTFLSNAKYPYLTALKSSALGMFSLFVLHFVTPFLGITMGINLFTSTFAIVLGFPGVICLTLIQWLLPK